MLKHETALVTGGAGFIGSHLVDCLAARGAHVVVFDNLREGSRANLEHVTGLVDLEVGDVRDRERMLELLGACRPRVVFHLAANASVPGSVADPVYDFETNCGGTFTLLEALRRTGIAARVVLASSGAVYGQPLVFPIAEGHRLQPISPYGASKSAAEMMAGTFAQLYGLPLVTARIFNTYGPRMARFVILDFLRKLAADPTQLEVLGTGEQIRDFTHVSDVVEALVLLAELGQPGEVYNVSSGRSLSVGVLAQRLVTSLGLHDKTTITYTGASWPGDAQRWEVSIDKIRGLGYRPHVALAPGLDETIAWFHRAYQSAGLAGSIGASG